MQTRIPIIKDSIKKNPDAGRTSTQVFMNQEIKFSYNFLDYDEFEKLEKYTKELRITSYSYFNETGITEIEGYLFHSSFIDLLPKEGLKMETKFNYDKVNHLPLPNYLYEYDTTTEVQCTNCKMKIPVSDIKEQEDYEGNLWEVCLNCDAIESYDYEYEKLNL